MRHRLTTTDWKICLLIMIGLIYSYVTTSLCSHNCNSAVRVLTSYSYNSETSNDYDSEVYTSVPKVLNVSFLPDSGGRTIIYLFTLLLCALDAACLSLSHKENLQVDTEHHDHWQLDREALGGELFDPGWLVPSDHVLLLGTLELIKGQNSSGLNVELLDV
ncbi:uncharacterized protein V6R79_024193 [Siganus canaliculatus]